MAVIINKSNMAFEKKTKKIEAYSSRSLAHIDDLVDSEHLKLNVRLLEPGHYSYPYHFHRHAEELFVILEGKGKLRTPEGIVDIGAEDIVFFEKGPGGAHQIKNDSNQPLKYLDIRTDLGMDVCEYPDSGKVNILPEFELYKKASQVDYFYGEEGVEDKW